MNLDEIFINHVLYGRPSAVYVSSDNEKAYFLLNGKLMYLEALIGVSFRDMTEAELNELIQAELTKEKISN
jgi:hypothetical protein